jgi:hypothetical protein
MKIVNLIIYCLLLIWNIFEMITVFGYEKTMLNEESIKIQSWSYIIIFLLLIFISALLYKKEQFSKWWLIPIAILFAFAYVVIDFVGQQLILAA